MTLEERVRHAIGDLVVQLHGAFVQIEELKARNADLEAEIAKLDAKTDYPPTDRIPA